MSLIQTLQALGGDVRQRLAALAGRTSYQQQPSQAVTTPGPDVGSDAVETLRRLMGGNLYPPTIVQTEWYLDDLDRASQQLDLGDFSRAAQAYRTYRRDTVISGLQRTKSGGIARLPKKWRGDTRVIEALTGKDSAGSVFDGLCPPTEIAQMIDDADALGAAVGILDDVPGRDYPVLSRLDPELLWYNWSQGQWYLRSFAGLIPIHPGDGRWVLAVAGPRNAPWQAGNWHSIARTWVRKDHALAAKDNWLMKLANAARVAISPQAATEKQRQEFFSKVMAWGFQTVFGLIPGWDVKILESNGRGWEGFDTTVKCCNEDFMIGICGQLVSVTGGTGFSSEDLYNSVRFDLIEQAARPMAVALSTQVVPIFSLIRFGLDSLVDPCAFEFDAQKPGEAAAAASVYQALGSGFEALDTALASTGQQVDKLGELAKFRIAAVPRPAESAVVNRILLTPSGAESVVTVAEARQFQGLPPFGDERDGQLLGADLGVPAVSVDPVPAPTPAPTPVAARRTQRFTALGESVPIKAAPEEEEEDG